MAALLLLLCCAVYMPMLPLFPSGDLDGSWQFAINAAVAQHKVFGRDVVFTFGPYAALYTGSYHPGTDGLAMVGGGLLAAAVAMGLLTLARAGQWLVPLGLAVFLAYPPLRDPLFMLLPLLFLAVAAGRPRGRLGAAATLLLAAALGLLVLIKGTFAAGSVVALAGGIAVLLRGRAPLALGAAAVAGATLIGAWLLAHQPLSAFPAFFRGEGAIVDGYTEAMAVDGPTWQVAAFVTGCVLVLLLNAQAFLRAGLDGVVLAGGTAALLLLAFKAGFVRQDEHVLIGSGTLLAFAAVLAARHRGVLPLLGLAAALGCAAPIDRSVGSGGIRAALGRVAAQERGAAATLLARLGHGSPLKQRYGMALAAIRAGTALPPITGTVDIYETGQSLLLANGLAWAPRPVLQSYSAYTPALAEADAQHLRSPGAPDTVLIRLETIDGRLPLLDDGPSWPLLLSRYALDELVAGGDVAVLRRQDEPSGSTLGAFTEPETHHLNEVVPLPPASGPLWAEIRMTPTVAERAMAAVFRPPPVFIRLTLADGRMPRFRFIPGMGEAGFLVSPMVSDVRQLLAMRVPGGNVWSANAVRAVTLEGDPAYWGENITIRIAAITIPQRPELGKRLFPPPVPHIAPANTDARCSLDMVNGTLLSPNKMPKLGELVRLSGWAYGDTVHGAQPDGITLALRNADGTVLSVPATMQSRPDVGLFFHQPHLTRIGFEALANLEGLHGDWALSAEPSRGEDRWSCPLSTVHIGE